VPDLAGEGRRGGSVLGAPSDGVAGMDVLEDAEEVCMAEGEVEAVVAVELSFWITPVGILVYSSLDTVEAVANGFSYSWEMSLDWP
jgi:hypothetical protein